MKVTREKRAANRSAIVSSAARLFRERGFDNVGVAEVMLAAGLTHGGFYGHFASKEGLFAEALVAALAIGADEMGREGVDSRAITDRYLSEAHLRDPGSGCAIAALAGEVARQPYEVRAAFAAGTRRYVDATADAVGDRAEALALLARLIGAVAMARALRGSDDALANEIIEVVAGVPTRSNRD